jgi:subtilisin-like proprotein convertase family protein
MGRTRTRLGLIVVGVLSMCLVFGSLAGVANAKKKKKASSTANVTVPINQVVPPATPGPPFRNSLLSSTTVLGKKFKGKQIGDVNATVSWTVSGPGSDLDDLLVRLIAPNGASSFLVDNNLFGTTLGPLTLDDEAPFRITGDDPADDQISDLVYAPYVGKATPSFIPLAVMDGGPAKGTWTLQVFNFEDDPAEIHTFGSWGNQVKTHPATQTK